MTTALRADDICLSIGRAQILRNVSFEVAKGEWVSLIGPSGCGKTSLLHVLALLDSPDSGRVWLGEHVASTWSTRRRAAARVAQIGLVFQDSNLLDHISSRENIALPAWLHTGTRKSALQAADRLIERFGLSSCADTRVGALSMGEAQRVAIARAIVNEPDIVLLDEPTGSLDAESGATVLDVLTELHAAGRTLLVVTHSSDVAGRASRVLGLRDGTVVERTT